ncbi:hypothetical protein PENTCL1PPCAC_28136, partial [Pristionchus entomophagus]
GGGRAAEKTSIICRTDEELRQRVLNGGSPRSTVHRTAAPATIEQERSRRLDALATSVSCVVTRRATDVWSSAPSTPTVPH